MKLHTDTNNVERIGAPLIESEFTIKTTAKAFSILSAGLYTDPELAVVRELSCNAYDSHVEAGKADTPFTIHLPNRMEPHLAIRDYGLGLCHTDVMELYRTYFASTKADSNDYIGALGLGSKSPFAYTSGFTVTSWFDGQRSMYSVFLNEEGIPAITRVGVLDTDETNGLEVRMTVDQNDFHTFKNNTADVLKYFPIKPEVVGSPGFTFNQLPENNIKGDGWFVVPQTWTSQRFTAVQGNVPYRVEMGKIREFLTPEENEFFEVAQIVAFFNIGDLDVAANREEIRYDDRSKQNLVKMARKIRTELTAAVERDISTIKRSDIWEAYQLLDKYSQDTFSQRDGLAKFIVVEDVTEPLLKSYIEDKAKVTCEQDDLEHWEICGYSRPRYSNKTLPKSAGDTTQLRPNQHTLFVVNDMSKGGIQRTANKVYNTRACSSVIMIRPLDHKDTSRVKDLELTKIINRYGNPVTINTSDMDNVSPTRQAGSRVTTLFQIKNHYYSGHSPRYKWDPVSQADGSMPPKGLYFFLSRGKTPFLGETTGSIKCADVDKFGPSNFQGSVSTLLQLINHATGTDYSIDDVYGAPITAMKALQKDKGWVNVFDLAKKSLKEFVPIVEAANKWNNTPNELGFKDLVRMDDFCDRVRNLDASSPFRQLLLPAIDAYNADLLRNAKSAMDFQSALRWYDSSNPTTDQYFTSGAFEVYPMLTFVGSLHYNSGNADAFFDYIQLIDRS